MLEFSRGPCSPDRQNHESTEPASFFYLFLESESDLLYFPAPKLKRVFLSARILCESLADGVRAGHEDPDGPAMDGLLGVLLEDGRHSTASERRSLSFCN